MLRASLLLGLLLSLAGCSALRLEIGAPLDAERCASFEEGRTRRAEVLAALGPPTDLAAHGEGVALLYEHVLLDERQLGVSFDTLGTLLGMPWLSLIKLTMGSSGSQRDATLLVFDADGILSCVGTGSWEEVFGRGGSVQFIAAVDQVVDSGTLRGPPRGLFFGREQLEPPAVAQNQVHRADLELRGTPGGAGQRSLEAPDSEATER